MDSRGSKLAVRFGPLLQRFSDALRLLSCVVGAEKVTREAPLFGLRISAPRGVASGQSDTVLLRDSKHCNRCPTTSSLQPWGARKANPVLQ